MKRTVSEKSYIFHCVLVKVSFVHAVVLGLGFCATHTQASNTLTDINQWLALIRDWVAGFS
jgi:hypothetical protein